MSNPLGGTATYAQKKVTIPSGAAVSNIISILGHQVIGVQTPVAWTAADIAIELDSDGSITPSRTEDSGGNAIKLTSIATGAIEMHMFDPADVQILAAARIRLRSVNTGNDTADVNQGADRTLTVILKPL